MRLTRKLLIVGFVFFATSITGQTKEGLKKQKLELEKEIRYTQELLNKINSKKTKSLNYLKVLDRQIKNKLELIIALNTETTLLNKQIRKTERTIAEIEAEIISKERRLKKLKKEYAQMIYAAFKQRGKKNDVAFIVSANDFYQAYKRILYLKQYSDFRKKQGIKIGETQKQLLDKQDVLAQKKAELVKEYSLKTVLMDSKQAELEGINIDKKEKENLVKDFANSAMQFKKQIQDKKKKSKKLDEKIRKIIEEEIAIAQKKSKDDKLTPETLALSSEFKKNKGRLPWPLDKGVIVSRYGKQNHPVFPGVEIFNNGIEIATERNTDVRAVFDGKVSRIFFVKGEGKAILINHGEYFSVYSGLKEVTAKTGEKVFSKEKIGIVLTHEQEDKTELHFEIWKGYEKENPTNWLYNAD